MQKFLGAVCAVIVVVVSFFPAISVGQEPVCVPPQVEGCVTPPSPKATCPRGQSCRRPCKACPEVGATPEDAANLKKAAGDCQAALEAANKRIAELEQKLRDCEAKADDCDECKTDLDSAKKEVETLKARIAELEEEGRKKQAEIARLLLLETELDLRKRPRLLSIFLSGGAVVHWADNTLPQGTTPIETRLGANIAFPRDWHIRPYIGLMWAQGSIEDGSWMSGVLAQAGLEAWASAFIAHLGARGGYYWPLPARHGDGGWTVQGFGSLGIRDPREDSFSLEVEAAYNMWRPPGNWDELIISGVLTAKPFFLNGW